MDLNAPIIYRSVVINGDVTANGGRILRGTTVEHVDYSNVPAVGYTEKRAAADGRHASDIYLDARILDMHGMVYATSPGEFFDFLHTLRSVMSPTSAYADSPGDRGFLPLYYSQPTLDVASFPPLPAADPTFGIVNLYINARPTQNVRFAIDSGKLTRQGKGPASTPWQVRLMAKDPRVYVNPDQTVPIDGAAASAVAGSAKNRGDYETPFNIMLVIGPTVPAAGTFRVTGLNNIDMTIKIEAVANVIYRWFGDDRVLMTQSNPPAPAQPGPFVLRMDLVSFATANRRPMVPASINAPSRPFATSFTYWKTVTLAAGSRLFWSEAFA